jgi:hypothetical protein
MTAQASIDGCIAKLDRADEHLEALSAETLAFLRTHPFELRGEVNKDAGRYSVRIRLKERPPARLGLIVGDAVHNLRAALDHLATNLAILGGAQGTGQNQFPILRDRPSSQKARARWDSMLSNVPPPARAAIDQCQPYSRPPGVELAKHSLWIVRRLSNEDKHRVVLQALTHVLEADKAPFDAVPKFEPVSDVGPPTNLQIGSLGPLEDEAEIYSADVEILGPKPTLKMRGALPIEPIYGADLVPARRIESACKRIRQVIEKFAPAFE